MPSYTETFPCPVCCGTTTTTTGPATTESPCVGSCGWAFQSAGGQNQIQWTSIYYDLENNFIPQCEGECVCPDIDIFELPEGWTLVDGLATPPENWDNVTPVKILPCVRFTTTTENPVTSTTQTPCIGACTWYCNGETLDLYYWQLVAGCSQNQNSGNECGCDTPLVVFGKSCQAGTAGDVDYTMCY